MLFAKHHLSCCLLCGIVKDFKGFADVVKCEHDGWIFFSRCNARACFASNNKARIDSVGSPSQYAFFL